MSIQHKVAYITLLTISTVWLMFIISAPAISQTGPLQVQLYYTFFHSLCHQLPERSFFIAGTQLPVCVRCIGVYSGVWVCLIILFLNGKAFLTKFSSGRVAFLVFTPIILDGTAQAFRIYKSPMELRYITGFLAGYGIILFALPLLNKIINNERILFKKRCPHPPNH